MAEELESIDRIIILPEEEFEKWINTEDPSVNVIGSACVTGYGSQIPEAVSDAYSRMRRSADKYGAHAVKITDELTSPGSPSEKAQATLKGVFYLKG